MEIVQNQDIANRIRKIEGKIANLKSMSDIARETLMSIHYTDTAAEIESELKSFDIRLTIMIKKLEDYIEVIEVELS